MDGKLTYGVSLVLGVLALVLLITNVTLINSNRHQQDNASQRQIEISKGSTLVNLNQGIIQALAEAAVSGNDTAARDLLAAQGITIKPNAAAKAAASESAKEAAEPKASKAKKSGE